jgi:hypothetical protein
VRTDASPFHFSAGSGVELLLRKQALQSPDSLLHVWFSGHALLARQTEPHGAQPMKHVAVLCIGGNL